MQIRLIALFVALLMAACAPATTPTATPAPAEATTEAAESTSEATEQASADETGDTAHPAAQALIRYLEARVAADASAMRELTCATEESKVDALALSFQGRDAKLIDVSCGYTGGERVACRGAISASYQGEARNFALPNYRVVEEDGAWRVCGETE